MSDLRNRIDQRILREQLLAEQFHRTTISFYQYFNIPDPKILRDALFEALEKIAVFGRIYIATEGINAQVSVPEHYMEAFTNCIYNIPELDGIRLNIAVDDAAQTLQNNQENNTAWRGKSFFVLKIKVRDKIVADGITDATFSMANKGKYVNAVQYNELAKKEDTIIVDMRNHYEYEVGHFDKAIEIPSDTFRDQLPMAVEMLKDSKEKNIIMYCTGGIRCEKASAYMLHHGFKNVYHLEGGIINYARTAKNQNLPIAFRGKNFVFDQRLGERITAEILAQCHQCATPCDVHTNCLNDGCHLLFIQCESCKNSMQGCCCEACKIVAALPQNEQAALRANKNNGAKVFNKSKDGMLRPRAPYRDKPK
jgi:UPF0176 protein